MKGKQCLLYLITDEEGEWVLCVSHTDSQSLEYCLVSVRLWPLGGANRKRDGSSLSIFKGAEVLAEAALVDWSQGCWERRAPSTIIAWHVSVWRQLKNKSKCLFRIVQVIIFHLYFSWGSFMFYKNVVYYINVLSHRADVCSTVFRVYLKRFTMTLWGRLLNDRVFEKWFFL